MIDTRTFRADDLAQFTARAFATAGLPPEHADVVGRDLVRADLRGVDSHGVMRIPMYLERLRRGLVNPTPHVRVTRQTAAVASVDADDAMGFIPAHRAMDEAMDLAQDAGIGLVGVRRSNHFGMAALYALQAIERGFVSMIFTNASPAIPMHGGRTTFLGASPLAAGVPGGDKPPFVMDMAMTVIARGKIRLAAQRGQAIPDGLALDRKGRPTTDAAEAFEGVCLPFGGVKGSVLATLMDLLSGVLTGAAYGGDVKNPYLDHTGPQDAGHLFFAIRPDLFMSLDDFGARMDEFSARVKDLPPAEGFDEVLLPGEPERRCEAHRREHGIPVTPDVIADLRRVADELDLAFPSPTAEGTT